MFFMYLFPLVMHMFYVGFNVKDHARMCVCDFLFQMTKGVISLPPEDLASRDSQSKRNYFAKIGDVACTSFEKL